jgi:hypothetical protein
MREALKLALNGMLYYSDAAQVRIGIDAINNALAATPEASLREHDTKLIESHTPLCEGGVITRQYMIDVAAKIMKG